MPARSQAPVNLDTAPATRAERRRSGRAQRRAAAEQAARRKQLLFLAGAVVAALAVVVALILLNRPRDAGTPIVAAAPLPASIPVAGTTMGQDSAAVTISEWGDFQCPSCGQFQSTVMPQLIAGYIEPGQARFEFHDYAFIGPESTRAAEAAACANDQDAFWPYHDTLYLNQHGENQSAFSDDRLKQMARTLGLDAEAFNACLDSGKYRDAVERSTAEGRSLGVNSTPSLFLNGTKIEWQGWEALKQAIDAALAQG
jgi:protein-disulfide isomerase